MRRKLVGYFRNRGFSMVGMLVAAGLIGGLALMFANMTRNQMASQKRIETEAEITAVTQRIVRTLYDGDACRHTLSTHSNPSSLPVISNGATLNLGSIRSKNDKEVFKRGSTYGNGLVKIRSLKLLSPAVTGNSAEAKLEVVMEKVSRAITGYKKKKKEYPLTLTLGTGNRLSGCVSDVSPAGMCADLGGTWDNTALTCSFSGSLGQCNPDEYFRGLASDGTMICADPLLYATCPSGKYLQGLAPGGHPVCVNLPSSANPLVSVNSCPGDKFLKGFDSGGSPVCADLPTTTSTSTVTEVAGKNCPVGEMLTGFDSSGDVVCEIANNVKRLTGTCERKFQKICNYPPSYAYLESQCPTGKKRVVVTYSGFWITGYWSQVAGCSDTAGAGNHPAFTRLWVWMCCP